MGQIKAGSDLRRFVIDGFSSGGSVSRCVSQFEERPEQVRLALAVLDALLQGKHLLVEAGTGVGKSLAYLLPAALWAATNSKRVVVSTHTINLQDQLIRKDLPLVAQALGLHGLSVSFSLLKGRNHYLCIRRWQQAYVQAAQRQSLFQATSDEKTLLDLYDVVNAGSWDGDRDTLTLPVPDSLWSSVCSESDHCVWTKCRFRDSCYYMKHRLALGRCHLIIANHALLASHLRVRKDAGDQAGLLPDFDAVIVDEAHHLEDVTRNSMGVEVGWPRLKRLADDISRVTSTGTLSRVLSPSYVRRTIDAFEDKIAAIQDRLRKLDPVATCGREKARIRNPGFVDSALIRSLREFAAVIEEWEDLGLSDEEQFEVRSLKRRVATLADDLDDANALQGDGTTRVYWTENVEAYGKVNTVVRACPLEVGEFLRETLWNSVSCAVLTSATLAVNDSFEYVKSALALDAADELMLGSPFNYGQQACFCVPDDCLGQDVNSPEFCTYVARKVIEIVDMVRGRTFVLFTARKTMENVAQLTRDSIESRGFPFLKQGDAPRDALLREFKQHGNAVLFGLDSFWEGVDVPGDALSCVVLAKIPFPVPEDPVNEAREELLRARGLSPFNAYTLPSAILKLRQGFGRLIRTRNDRGAIVLLDPRIRTKAYGRLVLRSLPPARKTTDLNDVAEAVLPARSGCDTPASM